MKRLLFLAIPVVVVLSFIFSCEDSPTLNSHRRTGPTVAGEIGQLLVVCDQTLWDSDLKECLDSTMTQFIMPYFPDVPTFLMLHKTPAHFERGVKRYRSILFVKLDPNYTGAEAKIEERKDVWAIDQLVIDVIAKDVDQLIRFCGSDGLQRIHDEFEYMDWRRILNIYQETANPKVDADLAQNFGIKLALPKGVTLVNKRKNFFRIDFPIGSKPVVFSNAGAQDRGSVLSGIMVYQYDYIDSSQFTLENLLQSRDTMLKYNAPYQVPGMYMGTQYAELVYPEGTFTSNYDGSVKGFEIRGMYTFVGRSFHAPGGAFWSFHFKHPKRNKLVCVSGFLDAPSTASWIEELRGIEAAFKSVELLD